MSLRDWRKFRGDTLVQAATYLADRLGRRRLSWQTLWRYEQRRVVPQPRIVSRLWEVTDGAVEPNSFYILAELGPAAMLARAERLEAEAAGLRALAAQRMGMAA